MSSMFQNLGAVRRGMVRPQQAQGQGIGNPAQGQEELAQQTGGSSFLPQPQGAGSDGGAAKPDLEKFMSMLKQAGQTQQGGNQAAGGQPLPQNHGYGGGSYGQRPEQNRGGGQGQAGGGGMGGAPGPGMGRPNDAARDGGMGGGGRGRGQGQGWGGGMRPGGQPPQGMKPGAPPQQPQQNGAWNDLNTPAGGGMPQGWGQTSMPNPQQGGGVSASVPNQIYNPQQGMAQAAQQQSPVSRAGAPQGGPQTDSAAPQYGPGSRDPMNTAPQPQGGGAAQGGGRLPPGAAAGGGNLGGQTREDYTEAGNASGGI